MWNNNRNPNFNTFTDIKQKDVVSLNLYTLRKKVRLNLLKLID